MDENKKIAIILSGCGVYDGSEIQEAVMAMYAVAKNGFTYVVFAPDIKQHHVINHITGEEMPEERNVMVESSRIARGAIKPLAEYDAADFQGLLLPGGFGAAKNLSDYAFKGKDATINMQISDAIKQTVKLQKPIGALCISPVILAKLLKGVNVTVGSDEGVKLNLQEFGANHIDSDFGETIVDCEYKVVTAPCYMLDSNILYVQEEAEKVVKRMIELMN